MFHCNFQCWKCSKCELDSLPEHKYDADTSNVILEQRIAIEIKTVEIVTYDPNTIDLVDEIDSLLRSKYESKE